MVMMMSLLIVPLMMTGWCSPRLRGWGRERLALSLNSA